MSKRWLQIEIDKQTNKIIALEKELAHQENGINKTKAKLSEAKLGIRKLQEAADAFMTACERESKKRERQLEARIKELEANQIVPSVVEAKDTIAIGRATTISIFDSIIFAISNWSTDGQTAPDFELACQSVLFPIVYEPVMKGNADYEIASVPVAALEIVRRGREYVKNLRSECDILLTDERVWGERASPIQEWWINDALPLLYGARDDEWNISTSLSLSEMLEWRDMPASRALHFPLIWDGMELVKKFADDIRDSSGLPEFNKQQLLTRIEP